MNIVGRSVKVVRLHSTSHMSGIGNITATVTENFKRQGDTKLTVLEGGHVMMQVGSHETVLYQANIISIELHPLK